MKPKPNQTKTLYELRLARIRKCKVCKGTGLLTYERTRIRCVACNLE